MCIQGCCCLGKNDSYLFGVMRRIRALVKHHPEISVIMGIFNCEDTLSLAIDSVLAQTNSDWELILCDDGSEDHTYDVAKQYQERYPDKIVLLKNDRNRGLNYTLNHCLIHAKGCYIARMDGDDLCAPERFEIEAKTLEREPEIAIVSTDMSYFDESGTWGKISHPDYPKAEDFMHGTPFCHAPCMVRREAYMKVKGYSISERLMRVEDYHLWVKMYQAGYSGKNIHQTLYMMRDDRNAYSRRKFKYRINEAYVRKLAIEKLNLPKTNYIYVLRPIVVGLLPKRLYDFLHKRNLQSLD